jgi:hypothetical protein
MHTCGALLLTWSVRLVTLLVQGVYVYANIYHQLCYQCTVGGSHVLVDCAVSVVACRSRFLPQLYSGSTAQKLASL